MRTAHLALIIGVAVAGTACSADEPGESSAPDRAVATIEGWNGPAARDACHDKVEDMLKSPATAEFENFLEVELTQSLTRWVVRGHVDSQNGFGATVRSEYKCTVTPENDDQAMVSVDSLLER